MRPAKLPEKLVEKIKSNPPPHQAIVLATTDDGGFPHFALLSYYELVVRRGHLFLSLHASTQSARFLEDRRVCTLALIAPESVVYLKARLVSHRRQEKATHFKLRPVELKIDVPAEHEQDVRLLSGIAYEMPEHLQALHQTSRDALLEAAGRWDP